MANTSSEGQINYQFTIINLIVNYQWGVTTHHKGTKTQKVDKLNS